VSTERWQRPPTSSNFHCKVFQLREQPISFDRWFDALVHGEIPYSALILILIRNFGQKSLDELKEAVSRMYFSVIIGTQDLIAT
jgi:hypothetical protein